MKYKYVYALALFLIVSLTVSAQKKDKETVAAEHRMIGAGDEKAATHNLHPDAQWYPEAGLGLFIHWGLASIKNLDISWPMIPGRPLVDKKLDSVELVRVVAQKDY